MSNNDQSRKYRSFLADTIYLCKIHFSDASNLWVNLIAVRYDLRTGWLPIQGLNMD